ncbi:ABC-type multidrug transport system, ATPase component [Paenibacillus uliginis N3/975]|uniref:ABC-type multidrug transport system, ATPase component n=1 Tax=Paenibacillus uliginis N3/975 TaxID=1313296 RepID=A0A1X7H9C8_9BACL|nr:ABC transporter ATP-binding protein [Paenibacillus uliginis]SMF82107.1 ABC-type multidrug transport system, ATPase component [Paenibacillus uliginis N3/975]
MKELIVLDKVSKLFGRHEAIRDVSWRISRGECVAVTGSNGAGKSTLLHLIAGLAVPSRGKRIVSVSNLRIGYVPERFPGLRFSPEEYLVHAARIQGMSRQEALRNIEGVLSLFQMQQHAKRRMNQFSKGMLQKVNLMQAMLGAPDLLMLDEPLSGLDEPSQHDMITVLGEIKNQGTAIVMSVHEPLLTAALADRVVVMKQGLIIRDAFYENGEVAAGTKLAFRGISPEAMRNLEMMNGFLYWISRGSPSEAVVKKESSDDFLLYVLRAGGSVISLQPLPEEQAKRLEYALPALREAVEG